MDMQFGLTKSGSCLISEISRVLDENIKLNYTIERLCNNLSNMYDEEKELMISYTKAILPYNKKEYTLVIVYGLSGENPMKLLTNIKNAEKEDVIKIVDYIYQNGE